MQAVANAIAERISSISESSTMKVAADAGKLRAEGVDVVDFGAGEPDFPTPDNIKQAAMRYRDLSRIVRLHHQWAPRSDPARLPVV